MQQVVQVHSRRMPVQLVAMAVGVALAPQAGAQSPTGSQLEEITVTATRRSQALSDVPISVSAIGDEELQQRGARQFDDIIRLTPGLNLTRQSFTGASQIAIRGISSNAGSGTTGIYIDDTPIQVRNMGFGSGKAFPGLFDIERVEVLRGPQGTLFGAGSEGGTVRFITTEPDLDAPSSTARAEMGSIENGDESYELGMAYGGPLSDRVAVRGSAYFRHDGGFVDAVGGTYEIVNPRGFESYGDSVNFTKTTTYEEDINWAETKAARLALKFAATDNVTITPSIFYQNVREQRRLPELRPLAVGPGKRRLRPPALRAGRRRHAVHVPEHAAHHGAERDDRAREREGRGRVHPRVARDRLGPRLGGTGVQHVVLRP